jgi:transcriptional regulator GlxA family with amidase domain
MHIRAGDPSNSDSKREPYDWIMTGDEINIESWMRLAAEAKYQANQLAKLNGVSPRHLRRLFQKSIGYSPQQWLNEMRLQIAAQRLSENRSVKEIAMDLGFADVSHFSHHFKRERKITPSVFQRLLCEQAGLSSTWP